MGFWSYLDRLVGLIPVVGTVKDATEALILECQGKTAEAKQKAIEAAVDLVGDVVTVATLGTGYEVAAVGKVAAEAMLKQGAEAATKAAMKAAVEQAAKDGFSKTAAKAIGAAAVSAIEKEKVKDEIARRNRKRKPDPRPPPTPEPSPKPKPSKRGEHVINVGVRNVLPQIIDDVVHHNAHHFHGIRSFEQLLAVQEHQRILRHLNISTTYNTPLTGRGDQAIERVVQANIFSMVAFIPENQMDPNNRNSVDYARHMIQLRVIVSNYVSSLLNRMIANPDDYHRLETLELYTQVHRSIISPLITEINTFGPQHLGVYVDLEALTYWRRERGSEALFRETRARVFDMFNALATTTNIENWARALYQCCQRHNAARMFQPFLKPISHLINRRDNQETPVQLGHQTDGGGDYFCAIAHTQVGHVPGKANRSGTCWYPYGGKELTTTNFSLIFETKHVSVRKIANDGHGPPVGCLSTQQNDAMGTVYVAVADTQWGTIPSKACGNTCWFPYGGKEHTTSHFSWVVVQRA